MQSSGLCFTFVKKAGVGLTAEHGTGFLIAHQVRCGSVASAQQQFTGVRELPSRCLAG